MSEQWLRSWKLVIAELEITGLDIRFDVVKTLEKEPNTCTVTVFNLSDAQRSQIQSAGKPAFRLEAGYQDDSGQIFYGVAHEIYSTKDGNDWHTIIDTADGEDAIKRARINKSFGAGTDVATVLRALAAEIKLDVGNSIVELQRSGKMVEAASAFIHGTVVSGKASTELDKILRSAGKEWSIQDGAFQLLEIGQVLQGLAVRLSSETGLIGAPSIGSDGILRGTCLLNYALVPGRQVEVTTPNLPTAFYKVIRTQVTGDSAGSEWHTAFEAKVLA